MKTINEDIKSFIIKNVTGKTSYELTELVNEHFKINLTVQQIKQYKKTHKLKSGIDTKFCKNQIPHNKKKLGDEFITRDGYVMIKVGEPNKWQLKHRKVWESNFGKIPENYSVIFSDGNKQNFDIENLMLIESKDKLTAKNRHLLFKNKELTKSGLLIARLINKNSSILRKKEK